MQIATILYNDRVNTYKQMKVLDKELDTKPTKKAVAEMAELRIRNLQCFSELKSFNNTGTWKNVHPLMVHHSLRFQLEDLRKKKPEEFLKQYSNCRNNINRYNSFLKSDKRSDKRESDKENLKKHMETETVFKSILQDENNRSI